MKTQIISLVAISALLFAGTATAYDQTRTGVIPGTANIPGVGEFGLATCELITGNGGSPVACDTGGLGVFFLFDTDGSTATTLDDAPGADTATGTCSVTVTLNPTGGEVAASCGSDRDDDTFVTNVDASAGVECFLTLTNDNDCDGNDHGTDADFDDQFYDFIVPGTGSNSVAVCFAHDASEDGFGSHDWDDIVVFLGTVAPGIAAGTADVHLTLSDSGADC